MAVHLYDQRPDWNGPDRQCANRDTGIQVGAQVTARRERCAARDGWSAGARLPPSRGPPIGLAVVDVWSHGFVTGFPRAVRWATRSEEHTSELQSRGHLVCRLLLE